MKYLNRNLEEYKCFYQENKKKREMKVFLNLLVSEIKILNFSEFENNIIM